MSSCFLERWGIVISQFGRQTKGPDGSVIRTDDAVERREGARSNEVVR
jgi:hypothetical protein